ncbi:MAG: DUF6298 domain-containing protein [Thermoguttaceae bacterium]
MPRFRALLPSAAVLLAATLSAAEPGRPISLHPENPHYLLFRGKPTILVTSGEHYGAVLNRDFDYRRYLDELEARGLNLTRTFSGTYREVPSSFGIEQNTLAPLSADRFVCPWARSGTAGAGDGGTKFDLQKWNPAYFQRLKDFLAEAGKRGIVVELVLFCAIYDQDLWRVNPMNPSNNLQAVGPAKRQEVYTLKDARLTAVQEDFVKKIVAELNEFDNLYYEICNEQYFAGVRPEWVARIAKTIAQAEANLPGKHLIAENIANGKAKITRPTPHVSIFNFHYASPPDAVPMNYGLNKVIADDETGFKGRGDFWYRREGWEFLLSGGGIYSSLDYSFTCSHPDGTFTFTKSPGGGGVELRKQLAILKRFLESFEFIRMKPNAGQVKAQRGTVRALVHEGRAYAVYYHGPWPAEITVELPAGKYRAEWLNTKTGQIDRTDQFQHPGKACRLVSPEFEEDIALGLRRA